MRENQLEMDFVATFGKIGGPNGTMCHATISMLKALFARRILQVSKVFATDLALFYSTISFINNKSVSKSDIIS